MRSCHPSQGHPGRARSAPRCVAAHRRCPNRRAPRCIASQTLRSDAALYIGSLANLLGSFSAILSTLAEPAIPFEQSISKPRQTPCSDTLALNACSKHTRKAFNYDDVTKNEKECPHVECHARLAIASSTSLPVDARLEASSSSTSTLPS